MSFRHRVVGRSEISCNEIAFSTELTLAREGSVEVRVIRVRPRIFPNSSRVTMFLVAGTKKSRTGAQNTRTCAPPARWFGLLEVVEGPVIDNTPIFVPENDPDVVRFRMQTGVWLDITPRFTPMKRSTMVCGRLAPIHAGRFRI